LSTEKNILCERRKPEQFYAECNEAIFDFVTAGLQSRWFWREACDGSLFTKAGNSPKTRGKYFLAVRKYFPLKYLDK